MLKVLHFSDAHIDITNHGRHDSATGLPVRVLDFLKSLDTIVDTAITEQVDLVLFAGDAYKDRTPVPTFQREWGKRIRRLSQAGIPTLLLVGNHDISPSHGRAHSLQEFETLQIPNIFVASKPTFFRPSDLGGTPVQILALPWVSRSSLMATLEISGDKPQEIFSALEQRLSELVTTWMAQLDPSLPVILTAHASVQGALYGSERQVMLGNDLVLPGSLVRDPRLDYVALGHIHKAQDLNENSQPPVVYPGSIERVDFGEIKDEKFFVIASVEKGNTQVEWRKLSGRRFFDKNISITSADEFKNIQNILPGSREMEGAIVRLVIEYPRELEQFFDETTLRLRAENALEFHLIRRPKQESRLRLPPDHLINEIPPLDLLNIYLQGLKIESEEIDALRNLAAGFITSNQKSSAPEEVI
jgi:exonuclease SbcD